MSVCCDLPAFPGCDQTSRFPCQSLHKAQLRKAIAILMNQPGCVCVRFPFTDCPSTLIRIRSPLSPPSQLLSHPKKPRLGSEAGTTIKNTRTSFRSASQSDFLRLKCGELLRTLFIISYYLLLLQLSLLQETGGGDARSRTCQDCDFCCLLFLQLTTVRRLSLI